MAPPLMFVNKKALLLDMNGTFMFGEDRFGDAEDFSVQYNKLGGMRYANEINSIIRAAYDYLDVRYVDETYQHEFPSLETAIRETFDGSIEADELKLIVSTFAYHELGYIPDEYISTLHELGQRFMLAAVIDIWSPKDLWLDVFTRAGIIDLFSALFFSSDHGIVKPSPKPFEYVLSELEIGRGQAVMIGDSPRRDLGGAKRAGIDCILVGGAKHPDAYMSLVDLQEFRRLL
ncbi:MAG: HAD family hydrolase [Rhodothermales bacterium]